MNGKVVAAVPAAAAAKTVAQKDKRPNLAKLRAGVSRDAQRMAAAILEVLAGMRTPSDAAAAVGLTVPRYYLWEQRALEGFTRACELRPRGKVASERHETARLQKEVGRLRQECMRQQALVRASQRTLGLAAASPPAAKKADKSNGKSSHKSSDSLGGKTKRKRRPVVRALKAAVALRDATVDPACATPASDSPSAIAIDVVQRSVASSSSVATEAASAAFVALES
jgi:hypothetical protein